MPIEVIVFTIIFALGAIMAVAIIIGFTRYYLNSQKLNALKAQADTLTGHLTDLQKRCPKPGPTDLIGYEIRCRIALALVDTAHVKVMAAFRDLDRTNCALQHARGLYIDVHKRLPANVIDGILTDSYR